MSIMSAENQKKTIFSNVFESKLHVYINFFCEKNIKFRVDQMVWKWVFWISKHIKIRTYNRNKKLFFWTFPDFKITPWNVNNTILFLQNPIKASEWNFFETFFSVFLSAPAHAENSTLFYMQIFAFFQFITLVWKSLILNCKLSQLFSCQKKLFS